MLQANEVNVQKIKNLDYKYLFISLDGWWLA
jgi:hypothetical protein